jgi:nitroreductase
VYTQLPRPELPADDPRAGQLPRVVESAQYLTDHFHEAPAMIVPCVEGRVENLPQFAQASVYGSILPAVWSLMLALRSRGLGSAWTTIHLMHEKEAAAILGIPETWTQAALLPVAYFTGTDFKPAKRLPLESVVSWNSWGSR